MSQESIVVEATPQETAQTTQTKVEALKLNEIKLPNDESIDPTYRGKTAADLIEMHKNASSQIGRQGQELGVWRGLVSQLSETVGRQAPVTATQETALKVTSDELLTNPVEAISKVVSRELHTALKPIKESRELDQRESELAALNRDFPTMKQTGDDPAFNTWANSAPGRAADARRVAQGDASAARRLLEAWADRQELTASTKQITDTGKPQGTAGARAAATESGGGGRSAPTGEIMNRQEIVELIQNKPELYNSEAYQQKLMLAAKEGRIR